MLVYASLNMQWPLPTALLKDITFYLWMNINSILNDTYNCSYEVGVLAAVSRIEPKIAAYFK